MRNVLNILRIGLVTACAVTAVATASAQHIPAKVLAYADTILHNGKVVLMDDRSYAKTPGATQNTGRVGQAVAVRHGRILAVGTNEEILSLAGAATDSIDLRGRTVIPGIINAHTHIHNHAVSYWISQHPRVVREIWRSFAATGKDFAELRRSIEVILKEHASSAPESQWMMIQTPTGLGGTGIGEAFVQSKQMTGEDLDKLAPRNPVIVAAHPVYVVNSAAKRAVVELYGSALNDEHVDADGFGSMSDMTRAIVVDSYFADKIDDLAEIVQDGMEKQAALGTTAFSSHIIGLRFFDALMKLDREERLPIRFGYTHYFGFQANENPAAFYMRFGDMAGVGSDYFWQTGVGLMSADSGPPRFCSSMEGPPEVKAREWCKNAPGTKVHEAVVTAIRNRQRVAVGHMYADRALDYFMDQIEEGMRTGPGLTLEYVRSRRFTADHCGFHPRPDQIPRLAKLGIILSCRAGYIDRSYPSLELYGMKYANWIAPARSMLNGSAKVVFESEMRVESGSGSTLFSHFMPFLTRRNRDGHLVAPEEAIDRVTMLKMATVWASEYIVKDDIGSLEDGKLADLLVLNNDYFTVPLEEIRNLYPLMTMVGGRIVVLREEFAKELGRKPVGPQIQFRLRQSAD